MKKYLIIICFILTGNWVHAQLPVDNGKISFNEVIPADSIKSKVLFLNALNWLKDKEYEIEKIDSLNGSIIASYMFPVYDKGYVTKKLNGKIKYSVLVDVKDYKYRYNFTDFVYYYYKENRYYKIVATGKKKPLEDLVASGWQGLWEAHKNTTQKVVKDQITQLKSAIIYIYKPAAEKKKVDW